MPAMLVQSSAKANDIVDPVGLTFKRVCADAFRSSGADQLRELTLQAL